MLRRTRLSASVPAARDRREPKVPLKKEAPAANPDAYIASLSGWRRLYAEALRWAVLDAAPLQERIKWGHLVYFSNGPALLIRVEDNRVLLGFWRGQRLRDSEARLRPGGRYEVATLDLVEGTPLERTKVVELITEAVSLNSTFGDPTDLNSLGPKTRPKPSSRARTSGYNRLL